ncbi:MAG TPA: flagellar protein FliS [Acidobacteriaceae bacterium]|nr:flagellar protein FliS [Acidobacteriaceae bacterium]
MNTVEFAYRKTAAAATGNGLSLLIALYDTLAGDLRRAADAERQNQIERRCREISHALLVIGYLEDWVHRGPGGELATQLFALYGSVRRNLIAAQVNRSPELLEEQMALVLRVRTVWQEMETRAAQSGPEILPPLPAPPYFSKAPSMDHNSLSWSA